MAKSNSSLKAPEKQELNLNLPLTKRAQSLKPYVGPIPSYLLRIEECAIKAGLAVTRMDECNSYSKRVGIFFAGTREQIVRCELLSYVNQPELYIGWPKGTRIYSSLYIKKFDPNSDRYARLNKITEDRYVISIRSDLPDSAEMLHGGIEKFVFDFGDEDECHVFIGSKAELIERGVARDSIFPDETELGTTGLENRAGGLLIEKTSRLYGDRWAYFKYTRREKCIKRRRQEELSAREPKSAEAFRDQIDQLAMHAVFYVHTMAGWRAPHEVVTDPFRFDDETLEKMHEKIRELICLVREGRIIKLRDPLDFKGMDAARSAQTDPDFQRFISRLLPGA